MTSNDVLRDAVTGSASFSLRGQMGRCEMALSVLLFASEFRAGLLVLLSVSFPVVRAADLFPAISEFEKNVHPVVCLLLVSLLVCSLL
jgi:hypothetical protein